MAFLTFFVLIARVYDKWKTSRQNFLSFEVLNQTWSNMRIGQYKFGNKINNKGTRLRFSQRVSSSVSIMLHFIVIVSQVVRE